MNSRQRRQRRRRIMKQILSLPGEPITNPLTLLEHQLLDQAGFVEGPFLKNGMIVKDNL